MSRLKNDLRKGTRTSARPVASRRCTGKVLVAASATVEASCLADPEVQVPINAPDSVLVGPDTEPSTFVRSTRSPGTDVAAETLRSSGVADLAARLAADRCAIGTFTVLERPGSGGEVLLVAADELGQALRDQLPPDTLVEIRIRRRAA